MWLKESKGKPWTGGKNIHITYISQRTFFQEYTINSYTLIENKRRKQTKMQMDKRLNRDFTKEENWITSTWKDVQSH